MVVGQFGVHAPRIAQAQNTAPYEGRCGADVTRRSLTLSKEDLLCIDVVAESRCVGSVEKGVRRRHHAQTKFMVRYQRMDVGHLAGRVSPIAAASRRCVSRRGLQARRAGCCRMTRSACTRTRSWLKRTSHDGSSRRVPVHSVSAREQVGFLLGKALYPRDCYVLVSVNAYCM